MPEPEAFCCFRALVTAHIPLYVRHYTGVLRGCKLLSECLHEAHPGPLAILTEHSLTRPEVYAFSSISSLNACVPPLADTVRLWDFELTFGVQWAILFVLARMILASQSVLNSSSRGSAPLITRGLEGGVGIPADLVIAKAVKVSATLTQDLLNRLSVHDKIYLSK